MNWLSYISGSTTTPINNNTNNLSDDDINLIRLTYLIRYSGYTKIYLIPDPEFGELKEELEFGEELGEGGGGEGEGETDTILIGEPNDDNETKSLAQTLVKKSTYDNGPDLVTSDLLKQIFDYDLSIIGGSPSKLPKLVQEIVMPELISDPDILERTNLLNLIRLGTGNIQFPSSYREYTKFIDTYHSKEPIVFYKYNKQLLDLEDINIDNLIYNEFYIFKYDNETNRWVSYYNDQDLDKEIEKSDLIPDYFSNSFGISLEAFCKFFNKEYDIQFETDLNSIITKKLDKGSEEVEGGVGPEEGPEVEFKAIEEQLLETLEFDNIFDLSEFKIDGAKSIISVLDKVYELILLKLKENNKSIVKRSDLTYYNRNALLEANNIILVSKYNGLLYNPEYIDNLDYLYDSYYMVYIELPYNPLILEDWTRSIKYIEGTYQLDDMPALSECDSEIVEIEGGGGGSFAEYQEYEDGRYNLNMNPNMLVPVYNMVNKVQLFIPKLVAYDSKIGVRIHNIDFVMDKHLFMALSYYIIYHNL